MTAEPITFADTVEALIPFLTARLAARGLPAVVSVRVPSPRPARLVRPSQVGGERVSIAGQRPRILFECWDTSEIKAQRLAMTVSEEVEAATRSADPIADGVWIGGNPSDFSLPVLFPDPLSATPRSQFTATLYLSAL